MVVLAAQLADLTSRIGSGSWAGLDLTSQAEVIRSVEESARRLTAFDVAVVAHAEHHDGDWDEHHAWHNSDWWHDNHPGWVYRHHPEWAETHNDWRRSDGDWDDHHAWHNRSWWYENRPDWVREHHHDWTRWHDDD